MSLYYVQTLTLLDEQEDFFWCETDLNLLGKDNFEKLIKEQITLQVLAKDKIMTLYFANLFAATAQAGAIVRIYTAEEQHKKAEIEFLCEHQFAITSAAESTATGA